MSPVCVPCGRFTRPKKNGVTVEELTEDGSPYKLWRADLYVCPDCGSEFISGFGDRPLAEHYQDSYATLRTHTAHVYPAKR